MTAVLRQLPFREVEDEVHFGLQREPVKPFQIVVWVSVAIWRVIGGQNCSGASSRAVFGCVAYDPCRLVRQVKQFWG
jgi:hypothetical protein